MSVTRVVLALALSGALASCGGSASRDGGSPSRESAARPALSNVDGSNPPADSSKMANHDTSIVTGSYAAPQQVDVVAYPPTGAVAPGQRFTLMVNVAPRAKMHVYAPGADGYKTVGLSIASSPYVHAQRVVFPKSEIYEFKPLKERVPAYQKPFMLQQEMTLDGSAAARAALQGKTSLTINGTFDYQACDDGTCYNPSSVPLTWTINLR